MIVLHPITLTEACEFVRRHHRHHRPPQGGLFAIGAARVGEDVPCAVAIVGRPVSRHLDDGWTAEITRLATDGEKNACSILYAAAWRAARAMGYRRLITYTLHEEGGASLRAVGAFRLIGEAGGGTWSRRGRPRVDKHPTQKKLLWQAGVLPMLPSVPTPAPAPAPKPTDPAPPKPPDPSPPKPAPKPTAPAPPKPAPAPPPVPMPTPPAEVPKP